MYYIDVHQPHGWVNVDEREELTSEVILATTILNAVVRIHQTTGRIGYIKARLILLVSYGKIYYDNRDEVA